MSLNVPCPYCDGKGHRPLSADFAEALDLLRSQPSELNGAALARQAGIEPTAMNNRLIVLEQMGFATAEWNGRERLWKANREGSDASQGA